MYLSGFNHWHKIPEIHNLREKKCILAHAFRDCSSWSAGSKAEISHGRGEEKELRWKASERERRRGQDRNILFQITPL